jgi:hypothetical protein
MIFSQVSSCSSSARVHCHQNHADNPRTRSRFKTTPSLLPTSPSSSSAIYNRYCHPGTICVRRFNSYSFILLVILICPIHGNPDAKRLYDDLLSNYNRLIRPVYNNTDTVLVRLGLRLSQLIDLVSAPSCVLIKSFLPFCFSSPCNFMSTLFKLSIDPISRIPLGLRAFLIYRKEFLSTYIEWT